MKVVFEHLTIDGRADNSDNKNQHFYLRYGYFHNDEKVYFSASVYQGGSLVDADYVDFRLSIEEFKSLCKMFLRFDERLTLTITGEKAQ